MRSRGRRVAIYIGVALSLLAAFGRSSGQLEESAAGERQIAGVVVDSVTGRPIARAMVCSGDRQLATFTDNEGRFVLRLVPNPAASGGNTLLDPNFRMDVTAQRPGYLYLRRPVQVTLGGGESAVKIALEPASSVSGTVLDEHGEPAPRLPISLLRWNLTDGVHGWEQVNGGQSGPEGDFHFAGLDPGVYTVASTPWLGRMRLPPKEGTVSQQYPPTFLGGARTAEGATRLNLSVGGSRQAVLHLRAVPFFPVVVPVASGSAGVQATLFQGGEETSLSLGYDSRVHALLGSLPDGEYRLQIVAFGEAGSNAAMVPLHIAGGGLKTAPVVLRPAPTLQARLHFDWTQSPPQGMTNVNVNLQAVGARGGSSGNNTQERPGEVMVPNVLPGSYRVQVGTSYGYAAGLRCGPTDLLRDPMVVGASSPACVLEVTLRDDMGTLQGRVEAGDTAAPAGAAQVFLLPPRPEGNLWSTTTQADGSFAFPGLPPGHYEAFAGGEAPSLAWAEPGGLDALTGKGVAVAVPPNGVVEARVPMLDPRLLMSMEGLDAR